MKKSKYFRKVAYYFSETHSAVTNIFNDNLKIIERMLTISTRSALTNILNEKSKYFRKVAYYFSETRLASSYSLLKKWSEK